MATLTEATLGPTGRFDANLAAGARGAQEPRERSAYKGVVIDPAKAEQIVATAERFVAAIEAMFE